MVSLEPFVFVGVGALILVGPKELPIIARNAGYYTGRAMAVFLQARERFQTFSSDAGIKSLHEEVTQGMQQLGAIRDELRTGINPFQLAYRPGPIARKAMDMAAPSSTASFAAQGVRTQPASSNPQAATSTSMSGAAASSHHEAAAATAASSPTFNGTAGAAEGLAALPISATKLGRLPDRRDTLTSGADFIADSIVEREVGKEAQQMVEQLAQQAGSMNKSKVH